ncbi:MAG: 2-C-methyl-D-erythritol 4-phosphate cytidylyltransferase [Candidatus Omnitrophota bacterium]
MTVSCIVPSAGKGRRLGFRIGKPFVNLAGKPILAHTLKALSNCKIIERIILVVSRDKIKACKKLVKRYDLSKVRDIVSGGVKRSDSVRNGLSKVTNADHILIHDGARPFIEKRIVERILKATKKYGAAICAVPSTQTIKLVSKRGFIVNTGDRKFLWEAQTPQGFRRDLIVKAYKEAGAKRVTDDSSLVERLGHKVKIVKGSPRNIKITTPEDLLFAKALLKTKNQKQKTKNKY